MGKPIDNPNRISPEEAARRLGMSKEDFCQCLIQKAFPERYIPGIAYKKPGNKNYTFVVFRGAVERLEQHFGFVD